MPSRGKPGIEQRQILQRDADATEPHRQSRRLVLRQHQIGAGLLQPRRQPARADAIEQRDRGNVERELQRALHRHRALERHVEILRRIGAEADRPVVDQALGMHEPVLEGQAVDERFQGRARRTHRAGHVDLPCPALVEIIGGADPRQHVAAGIVDHDDRNRNFCPSASARSRASGFEHLLQIGIERQLDQRRILHGRDGRIGRNAAPASASACAASAPATALACPASSRAIDAFVDHAIEHAVARGTRRLGIAVQPARLRRLRQGHQQRRFGQGQPLRLLAEIGDRGGADAFEIAAERRQREIEIEDLLLAQLPLDLDRTHDLAQLGVERAVMGAAPSAARAAW